MNKEFVYENPEDLEDVFILIIGKNNKKVSIKKFYCELDNWELEQVLPKIIGSSNYGLRCVMSNSFNDENSERIRKEIGDVKINTSEWWAKYFYLNLMEDNSEKKNE